MARIDKGKTLLDFVQLEYILQRLTLEVIENHILFEDSILVGIQPRGVELCNIIHSRIEKKIGKKVAKGSMDISLHRDDIHLQDTMIDIKPTEMPLTIENKKIILIDDVLYTGRTIRSALDTLMDFGRPKDVELLVLIDRRLHRNLPIQAKYIGKKVDSIQKEKVKVFLNIENEKDRVELIN